MNELVITKINNVETIDSRIVATKLGVEHRALIQLIRKHQESIEINFDRVAFEMLPLQTDGGVQNSTIAHLTEDQSIFIGSLSRNTQKVIEFKAIIVKAFSEARKPKELTRKELALMVVRVEEEKEQLQLQVENLNTALDSLVEWVSIIKVSTVNKVKESIFDWRKLKKTSESLGYEIKKAQSPRFGYQNLYHFNAFKVCYPQFVYNF